MMGVFEHSNEPLGAIKRGIFCISTGTITFSGRSLHYELNTSKDYEVCREEIL
jgi:hypothetical protein